MINQSKRTIMPGCVDVDVNNPDEMVEPFSIKMNGALYLPVRNWEFGEVIGNQGSLLASIFLSLPTGFGLHAPMTSFTLRNLANKMIEVADKMDDQAATQAKAAIDAARGKAA